MSSYHFNGVPPYGMNTHHQTYSSQSPSHSGNHHSHHGGRSRRGQRFAAAQNSQKQYKQARGIAREVPEVIQATSFRKDFEAARSFDLEDDEIFCPWHLLTEDDLHSMTSSASDRSSSSSGSPEQSPLQHQLQPTPGFSLPGSAAGLHTLPPTYPQPSSAHLKLHAPMAQRTRNAIPIVDPSTRNTSPPSSISPANMQKGYPGQASRRW